MPDPPADPAASSAASRPDLPLIREFDDRSALWLLEDPQQLRGLLQILDPPLTDRLDFARSPDQPLFHPRRPAEAGNDDGTDNRI